MKTLLGAALASIVTTVLVLAGSVLLSPEDACALRIPSCNPRCGACSANIKGTWRGFTQGRDNTPVLGPLTFELTQNGYRVNNTNQDSPYTLVGTVFGSSFDFSLTVSGEELEGYVNHCEGHVRNNNQIFAVCLDRDNQVVTFTAQKQ
jgi:hypothetical protein